MLPLLIIHSNLEDRQKAVWQILSDNHLSQTHPNVFYLDKDSNLGVAEIARIRNHLNLKPYQKGKQTVVILSAENLSVDAQNSLLKTLEEPPQNSLIILASSSEDQLLPTIISRCQVHNIQSVNSDSSELLTKYQPVILELTKASIADRFKFIEKLTERQDFLKGLIIFFEHQLLSSSDLKENSIFLKDLIKSEKLLRQNVNLRAILEYLMLKLPKNIEITN